MAIVKSSAKSGGSRTMSVLSGQVVYQGQTASGTLHDLAILVLGVDSIVSYPFGSPGEYGFFAQGLNYGLEGTLDADLFGVPMPGVSLAGITVSDPSDANGQISIVDGQVSFNASFSAQLNDSGSPVLPGGMPTLGFFGFGEVNAGGVIPAPGSAALLALGGAAITRRRRVAA
jgi:uncharacterized protein (TIGR03382 family)